MLPLVALLATVINLPLCPQAVVAGADLQTVTEGRSVVERFSIPGEIALHGPAAVPGACATCDAAGQDQAPDIVEPQYSGSVPVQRVAWSGTPGFDLGPAAGASNVTLRAAMPASHAPGVLVPPPKVPTA
jgi:hypothetical protein